MNIVRSGSIITCRNPALVGTVRGRVDGNGAAEALAENNYFLFGKRGLAGNKFQCRCGILMDPVDGGMAFRSAITPIVEREDVVSCRH